MKSNNKKNIGAKIFNSCALNTKITFILLFDFILPIFESFQKSPKIALFELSQFVPENYFFQKSDSNKSQRILKGLFNAKNLKK